MYCYHHMELGGFGGMQNERKMMSHRLSQTRCRTDFCIQILIPLIPQPVSGSYFTNCALRNLNLYIDMGNLYQSQRVHHTVGGRN